MSSAIFGFGVGSSTIRTGVKPLDRLPSPEELLKYHVIIIGDVQPEARDRRGEPIFYEGALETIKELVKDRGGGLMMISGEEAAPRLYAKTPIADLLPILIQESSGIGSGCAAGTNADRAVTSIHQAAVNIEMFRA